MRGRQRLKVAVSDATCSIYGGDGKSQRAKDASKTVFNLGGKRTERGNVNDTPRFGECPQDTQLRDPRLSSTRWQRDNEVIGCVKNSLGGSDLGRPQVNLGYIFAREHLNETLSQLRPVRGAALCGKDDTKGVSPEVVTKVTSDLERPPERNVIYLSGTGFAVSE